MKWFIKTPRYIKGELIENQWFLFGGWLVYHPEPETPNFESYEFIYKHWRLLWGWENGKFFGALLLKFWPHIVAWGV